MLSIIDELIDQKHCAALCTSLLGGNWLDGRASAGSQAALRKSNQQLDDRTELAQTCSQDILTRLVRHPEFIATALPRQVFPPRFNCYRDGGYYATHSDSAIMAVPGSTASMRTDISATLFLSPAASYDGGELVIEGESGAQPIKLEAGSLVLYPSGSLHQVCAVTRGVRLASFFWVQSLVRDSAARALLFDLDQSIQNLTRERGPQCAEVARLSTIYHNLLRRWSDI